LNLGSRNHHDVLLISGSGSPGLSLTRCRTEQAQLNILGHSRLDQPRDALGGRPPLDSLSARFGLARWPPVRAEVAQVHAVQDLAAGSARDRSELVKQDAG